MSQQTAEWYVKHTGGQLQAFLHADGCWYLYAPKPVTVGITPRVPIDSAGQEDA